MTYFRRTAFFWMLFFTRNTVAAQDLGLIWLYLSGLPRMCGILGMWTEVTGTWLSPTDTSLPPAANNQGFNWLCHLVLTIGTTAGPLSVVLLK